MTITVDGFREVLDILKGLFSGLKSATSLPVANRREMRDALADMAELIDRALTILKQHLNTVLAELKFGDEDKGRSMVHDLGVFSAWEDKYRSFQICDALRTSLDNVERSGILNLRGRHGVADAQTIHQRLQDYIGGETNAARFVSMMLARLSALFDTARFTREEVISTLEDTKKTVIEWQQKFTDLEQQIRSTI